MNFNELSYFVYQKYGLKFKPAIPGATNLYYLSAPQNEDYFAILSRMQKFNQRILTLDLKTGDFTDLIKDLPGFSDPIKIKESDWVGIWLDQVSQKNIENAFDYAYKLAVNKRKNLPSQPYLVLPGESNSKYSAQAIPKRKAIKKQIDIPAAIQKMRESYDYSILPAKGRAKNFYHQAKMMADYNEDYQDFAAFKRYYPTYHDMSVKQLQTYFAWRGKIRKGEFYRTSSSYCYVYIYELLNKIGVKSAIEGFKKLTSFLENYAQKYDLRMSEYLVKWIKDYIIYYHLEDALSFFKDEQDTDQQYLILLKPKENSVTDVYQILCQFSPYLAKLNTKTHGENFQKIVYYAWKNVLKAKSKIPFFTKYVAKKAVTEKHFFAGAIFYPVNASQQDLVIDLQRKYFYQNGRWYLESLEAVNRQKVELNNFFHEVDRLYRLHFHLGKLKPRKLEFEYLQAIQDGILEFEKQEKQAKQKRVQIDFSSLDKIRLDAGQTRDSLLTDEEKKLEKEDLAKEEQLEAAATEETGNDDNEYDLSADELEFLRLLIQKKSCQAFLNKKHLMASILADAINEKLLDEIGDSVIEFNTQDQPQIVEDYQEDLEEMF